MSDKNPKKRLKQTKISLKPEFVLVPTVSQVKAARESQHKPGHK